MMKKIFWVFGISAGLAVGTASAEVKLPSLFSDNAVLQQGQIVPVWGTAKDGEKVTVAFAGQSETTTAQNGEWIIKLKPLQASTTPQTMTVTGANTITVTNLLVGEVWIASGQSNMEWPLSKTAGHSMLFTNVDKSLIRVITVKKELAAKPKNDITGQWIALNSPAGPSSTAVGSLFAMNLLQELKVPVGIISSSWGGSRIELWIGQEAFERIPGGQTGMTMSLTETEMSELEKKPWNLKTPSLMYNTMIRPVERFAMRGALWYQGESNVGEPLYEEKMKVLIDSWRQAWNIGEFPFYFVQIAPFRKYSGENLGRMWEAQLNTLRKVPNTGMAVLADNKQFKNIHPKNKPEVGKRLALWALAKTYNQKVVYSGPLYRGFKRQDDKMIIEFDHVEGGLVCSGEQITDVTVKGEGESAFVQASPVIEGGALVVKHPEGKKPVAVRMGWNEGAMPNLMNKEGLPASPFRTDVD